MKKIKFIYLLIGLMFVLAGCAGKNPNNARFSLPTPEVLLENRTNQMWQVVRSERIDSYEDAKNYADALTLGGYDDWRLPTIYELYDLNYLFDLHKNGEIVLDRNGNYWSGEKDGEGMIGAWEISDQCDPERQYETGKTGYVRATRP